MIQGVRSSHLTCTWGAVCSQRHLQQCTWTMLHAGFSVLGRMGMNQQAEAEQRGCPAGPGYKKNTALRNSHLMHQFLAHVAFLHCQAQGKKLKSMGRAGISFTSTFILLHWENGFILILHHRVFQQKEWNCRLCSWDESPLGCTVPRSKKDETKAKSCRQPKLNEVKDVPLF